MKLSHMNKMINCRICGAKTHDVVAGSGGVNNYGLELCGRCIRECEMENAHSDGRHDEQKNAQCHLCNEGVKS